MTSEAQRNSEDWTLHAYVDGEVPAELRAEIEMRLARDPEAALSVEAWRSQKLLIREAFDPILDEPLPDRLANVLKRQPAGLSWPLGIIAAALALVLLGGAAGWFVAEHAGTLETRSLAAEALAAHQVFAAEVRHPVEVGAEESDQLATWLSKRLGHALKLPDLTPEGYTLLGGRLLAVEGRPAAQLMYEDQSKRRITIFLASNTGRGETAIRIEQNGPLSACYWLDGPFGFAVAGELDRERLMGLAHAVYRQFEG